jgi:hypothetical protein
MVINLEGAKVVEVCSCGTEHVVVNGTSGTEIRIAKNDCEHAHRCAVCETKLATRENHFGSPFCENGSLAAGGRYAHCQCDICSSL